MHVEQIRMVEPWPPWELFGMVQNGSEELLQGVFVGSLSSGLIVQSCQLYQR